MPPGAPIPAEPELVVGSMPDECGALLAAFDAWKRCENLDDHGRANIEAWRELEKSSFDASEKAKPDAPAQHAIAVACRRGIASVRAATERCGNGKPPTPD